MASSSGSSTRRAGGPTKATLIRGLFQQEIGSLQPGPAVGESAPDFTLRDVGGDGEITLSNLLGDKPVVLVFGNITCGPFRGQAGNVEKLYRRYKDRVNFAMVYVREAHPIDGWFTGGNAEVGVAYDQPKTFEERVGIAQTCQRKLGFDMPFLVDAIDDPVGGRYSGMPSRLYVIDRTGKVAYKSGRGPFGFKPLEAEQALIWTLLDESKSAASATATATAEAP
jgi:thiol-disulfide isomerase/thioredoxin